MAKKKSSPSRGENKAAEPEVDFESVLAEVEQIVHQLESGELDLTESLQQYERGVRQLKNCHAILDAAQRRVTVLSGFDADGNAVTQPLPETSALPSGHHDGQEDALGGGEATQPSMDDPPGLF